MKIREVEDTEMLSKGTALRFKYVDNKNIPSHFPTYNQNHQIILKRTPQIKINFVCVFGTSQHLNIN